MSRKIIWKRCIPNFLDYQDSDALNKINGFSPQYSSTSDMFQTEFLMEEFDLVSHGDIQRNKSI